MRFQTLFTIPITATLIAQVPAPKPFTLADLAWMHGDWQGQKGKEHFDEHWHLQGDSMLGVSRTSEAGRSTFFELFVLEATEKDLILRLRMFGPAGERAVRGQNEPLRLKVVELDKEHVVFEGLGKDQGTQVRYQRMGTDGLEAEILKHDAPGKVWRQSYSFKRIP
jgi:Domain of unknown function (DUF6265)